jgi:membrane protease YdiL (CAAX protease family)
MKSELDTPQKGKMNIMTTIKRYPAVAFVSITFTLSVVVSFAPLSGLSDADKFLILGALIVPIPTMVAIALAAVTGSVWPFLREALNVHLDWRWALVALGLAVGARLLVSVIALATGAVSALEMSAIAPPLIVVIYLFALLEEIGWRGYAVRRLVITRSVFAALLITGLPWSAIHIFFYLAQNAALATLLQVFMLNFALTVMVTWVYLRGGQKVWIAVILHGSQSLFSILNTNLSTDLITPYSVVAYSLIAVAILVGDRPLWFAGPAQAAVAQAMQAEISSVS